MKTAAFAIAVSATSIAAWYALDWLMADLRPPHEYMHMFFFGISAAGTSRVLTEWSAV